jgi:hypothetical protein
LNISPIRAPSFSIKTGISFLFFCLLIQNEHKNKKAQKCATRTTATKVFTVLPNIYFLFVSSYHFHFKIKTLYNIFTNSWLEEFTAPHGIPMTAQFTEQSERKLLPELIPAATSRFF